MKKDEKGITVSKEENFSEWYTQLIQKAELIEYSSVSGCLVLRPYAYELWERIQDYLDKELKKKGVKNAYFPLFIPEPLLKKKKKHVEGFNPEVAWVTHTGTTKLKERLAIRPTSETIIYESYKKWIRSHRDLPLLINQWCNVVRWEFKDAIPFIRTREFLWQEGHTVFASEKESISFNREIISIYKKIFEELLSIPVLTGRKSEKEKFAGADFTESVEALMPNGKAVQGATSHGLGTHFSKAFEITYLDKNEKEQYAWQNSWGFTTRSIGMVIMVHSDDKGLVLPPLLAPIQIRIIPIFVSKKEENIMKEAREIKKQLSKYRIDIDERKEYSPGWKFNEVELKGIPLRIEIGPKDIEKKQVILVRRDTLKKEAVKRANLKEEIEKTLLSIQKDLFERAKKILETQTVEVKDKLSFLKAIQNKKIVKAQWCATLKCEEKIKEETEGAKSLNAPFDQKRIKGKCAFCTEEAKQVMYFGKSY